MSTTSLTSFLTSLGLGPTPRPSGRRTLHRAPLTRAQRRSLERSLTAHIPLPTGSSKTVSSPPSRGREITPSTSMDFSTVKWHPNGAIRTRPGIPADLGVVGKPLTDRKIAAYELQGRYGLEAKRLREENNLIKKAARSVRQPRTPSAAEEWVRDVLGL